MYQQQNRNLSENYWPRSQNNISLGTAQRGGGISGNSNNQMGRSGRKEKPQSRIRAQDENTQD